MVGSFDGVTRTYKWSKKKGKKKEYAVISSRCPDLSASPRQADSEAEEEGQLSSQALAAVI